MRRPQRLLMPIRVIWSLPLMVPLWYAVQRVISPSMRVPRLGRVSLLMLMVRVRFCCKPLILPSPLWSIIKPILSVAVVTLLCWPARISPSTRMRISPAQVWVPWILKRPVALLASVRLAIRAQVVAISAYGPRPILLWAVKPVLRVT